MVHLRTTRVVLVLVSWSLLAVAVGPAAPSTSPLLVMLDAADRVRDAGRCASDGESMREGHVPNVGGGWGLEFPHHGCWAEWEVELDGPSALVVWSGAPSGAFSRTRECVQWSVTVDGLHHGVTPRHCGDQGVAVLTPLPLFADPADVRVADPVPYGAHTLRVTGAIVEGPAWANAYVQHLVLAPSHPLPEAS